MPYGIEKRCLRAVWMAVLAALVCALTGGFRPAAADGIALKAIGDAANAANKETLQLPAGGQLPVILTLDGVEAGKPVDIVLSDFTGTDGTAVSLTIGLQSGGPRSRSLTLDSNQKQVLLHLDGSAIRRPGRYYGELRVSQGGQVKDGIVVEVDLPGPRVQGAEDAGKASLTVPFDGLGRLAIDTATLEGRSVDIAASAFVGAKGGSRALLLSLADGNKPPADRLAAVPLGKSLVLSLDAGRLEPDEAYNGSLVFTLDGQDLEPLALAVTREKQAVDAVPVLDRATWQADLTQWSFWRWPQPATVHFVLSEKSGNLPLQGVSLSVVSVTSPDGSFDPLSELKVALQPAAVTPDPAPPGGGNRQKEDEELLQGADLWRLDPGDPANVADRSVRARGRAVLAVDFPPLEAGEYKVKLKVHALNATQESAPELDLSVKVTVAPVWPIAVLFLFVMLSYVVTKGIQTYLKRHLLLREIDRLLQTAWLRNDQTGLVPVVQASAVLHRLRAALESKSGGLSVPYQLEEELEAVKKVMPLVGRVVALWGRWVEHPYAHRMVSNRMRKLVTKVVQRLGDARLDPETAKALEPEVAGLEQMTTSPELDARYWASLKADIEWLKSVVRPEDLRETLVTNAGNKPREVAATIKDQLKLEAKPANLDGAIQLEEPYAKLKLIWGLHIKSLDDPEGIDRGRFNEFVDACEKGDSLDALFARVNGWDWADLTTESREIRVEQLGAYSESLRQYALAEARVVPYPDSLANSYLFTRGLLFEWKVFREGEAEPLLRTKTREPRLTFFVRQESAQVVIRASIRFEDPDQMIPDDSQPSAEAPKKITSLPLNVEKTNEFRLTEAFYRVEMVALLIAAAVAVFGGMETDAYDAALLGSWSGFFGLAIWALAADQVKNLLQTMGTYLGTPAEK